jgi:hypothetical protein
LNLFPGGKVLHSIGEKIRVGVSKNEWTELHDGDEPREVQYLIVRVSAVEYTREIKKFRALVDFCPEPFLQRTFRFPKGRCFLYQVEVGEHTDDLGETVGL